MDKDEKAIVRTLIYSDVFDHPLTEEEVWKYLEISKPPSRKIFRQKIKKINSVVYRSGGYLYLKGKDGAVGERTKKTKYSSEKLRLAEKTAKKLFLIPTIKFIGISGSLSILNAKRGDDIDLFVIAKSGNVWITRFLLIVFLKFLGKHRKRGDKKINNKFCINMIVGEDFLEFPKKLQNLYTAREIAQLRPLFQRNGSYRKFLVDNSWVENFLPNSISHNIKEEIPEVKDSNPVSLKIFETPVRFFQKLLMKKYISKEIIDDNFIALHPKDYKSIVLSGYSAKISEYGLKI